MVSSSSSSSTTISTSNSSNNQQQQSKQIMVFASIVQELISYVERFPRPGESVRGTLFKTYCGGKGANQAVMAAKLGSRVKMAGMVGRDVFADYNINSLAGFGVDIELIQKSESTSTATATINVNTEGENLFVFV